MGGADRQARKEKQAEFIREQFIEAAWNILREQGVRAVTVDEVARRAGYAPGSVYNYFASKDELLVRAVQRDAVKMVEPLQEEIPEGLTVEQGLTLWVRNLLKGVAGRRTFITDLASSFPIESREAHREMHAFMMRHVQKVVRSVAKQLAKLLPESAEAPEVAAWVLLGIMREQIIRWMFDPGSRHKRLPDQAGLIVRVFLYGVLGRPAGSARKRGGKS